MSIIVSDTSMAQMAHGLECLARRPNFRPNKFGTDTWPNNKLFFDTVFLGCIGFLGMFHFMNRVFETLDDRAPFFYEAVLALRKYVLLDSEVDLVAVRRNLTTRIKDRMTAAEVAAFEKTKQFRSQHMHNIRSIPKQENEICIGLEKFKAKYEHKQSPGNGRKFFSAATFDAIKNGKKKAGHLTAGIWEHAGQDGSSDPVFEYVFERVNAGSGNLPIYRTSMGTESRLESFHATQAQFANVGMAPRLAATISMDGIVRHNRDMRHRFSVERLSESERGGIHSRHRREARHNDHSYLAAINEVAADCGLGQPHFNHVEPLPQTTNNEKFYWDYFEEQELRNKQFRSDNNKNKADRGSRRCPCLQCGGNATTIEEVWRRKREEQEPSEEVGFRAKKRQSNDEVTTRAIQPKKKCKNAVEQPGPSAACNNDSLQGVASAATPVTEAAGVVETARPPARPPIEHLPRIPVQPKPTAPPPPQYYYHGGSGQRRPPPAQWIHAGNHFLPSYPMMQQQLYCQPPLGHEWSPMYRPHPPPMMLANHQHVGYNNGSYHQVPFHGPSAAGLRSCCVQHQNYLEDQELLRQQGKRPKSGRPPHDPSCSRR